LKPFIKKNFFTAVWVLLLGVLLLYPPAKISLLRLLINTGIFNAGTKKKTNISKEALLPNLFFIDQNGIKQDTADLKGKVIFINFWATWCPPCVAEMGSVNALYNKLKDDPRFVFIIADTDNNLTQSISFMKKNKYDLPVYGLASSIPESLFTGTIPTTLIIDAKGNIVQKHEGIANYDTEGMVTFLQSLSPQPLPLATQ
jgi:thiol-disulfide isomerase/thioredoxin